MTGSRFVVVILAATAIAPVVHAESPGSQSDIPRVAAANQAQTAREKAIEACQQAVLTRDRERILCIDETTGGDFGLPMQRSKLTTAWVDNHPHAKFVIENLQPIQARDIVEIRLSDGRRSNVRAEIVVLDTPGDDDNRLPATILPGEKAQGVVRIPDELKGRLETLTIRLGSVTSWWSCCRRRSTSAGRPACAERDSCSWARASPLAPAGSRMARTRPTSTPPAA